VKQGRVTFVDGEEFVLNTVHGAEIAANRPAQRQSGKRRTIFPVISGESSFATQQLPR
jgi:hypothetical protein